MFRKTLFWIHLCCGVAVGLVVFTMSFTGVALMYERQVAQWAARQDYLPAQEQQGTRLALEKLIEIQQTRHPDVPTTALTITNDPGAPVEFRAGRRGGVSLNPYNGAEMTVGSPKLSAFFSAMTSFHRWFSIEGENRNLARQVTGVSNVVFLFLVLSGMYLWLPKLWKWTLFKARLLFRSDYPTSRTRDFHWHHIFGIWAALPLVAVVFSGAVISYPWAANLMYRMFGAQVPQQVAGGPGGGPGAARAGNDAARSGSDPAMPVVAGMPLDALLQTALAHSGEGWNRVNLTLPQPGDAELRIEIDKGTGAQAQRRHTLVLARQSGAVVDEIGFGDTPKAQRLRTIARFLHTGEVLGFWGQTVAGLASFAALFLVWTGLALSWRRLIVPLFNKKKAA
jgi:uncharacterized iron-regulated membrane protein